MNGGGFDWNCWPGVARRQITLLLLRQIDKSPKKRRPGCLGPFASLRATCADRKKRGASSNSPAAQTIARPDPAFSISTGPARTGLAGSGSGSDSDLAPLFFFLLLPLSPLGKKPIPIEQRARQASCFLVFLSSCLPVFIPHPFCLGLR